MDYANIALTIATYAVPVLLAITLHEAAHGYVARHYGDSTAWMLGRVTLNPVKHIDPLGTLLVPIVTVLLSPYMFGWAKPVPVNFNNLRHPKRDMLWVAAAGPASNVVQMLAWAAIAMVAVRMAPPSGLGATFSLLAVAEAGIRVNVIFAILNLFPVLPLDGGRIVMSLLPGRLADAYSRLEPYGMVILLVLLFSGALGWLLLPFYRAAMQQIYSVIA